MKERWMAASVLMIAGMLAGCAGTTAEPSKALVRARALHRSAAQSQAGQLASVELKDAQRILHGAELEHRHNPRSNMEMHLSNLAAAKFQIAMAEARRHDADRRLVEAQIEGGRAEQLAQRNETLEAERAARLQAEERAREALQRLEEVGSVRQTEEGTVLTLTGAVLFRIGESELLPIARQRLGTVAQALKAQGDGAEIVIEGHADATGPSAFNDELSQRRAERVKEFLVSEGVEADRLRAVGRGEREPIATNDTPEGRANNRRVEIVIPGEA